jgi:hypothetical protein
MDFLINKEDFGIIANIRNIRDFGFVKFVKCFGGRITSVDSVSHIWKILAINF